MLLSFTLCNFLVRMLKYLKKKLEIFFCPQKVERNTSKSCILMANVWVFFSAVPNAQNSPELHIRFINSPIQSSVLKSVITTYWTERIFGVFWDFSSPRVLKKSDVPSWQTYLLEMSSSWNFPARASRS